MLHQEVKPPKTVLVNPRTRNTLQRIGFKLTSVPGSPQVEQYTLEHGGYRVIITSNPREHLFVVCGSEGKPIRHERILRTEGRRVMQCVRSVTSQMQN